MEKNELSNSNLAGALSSALHSFKEFNPDSFKDLNGVNKFLPMPLSEISVNLHEIAESLKNQPLFDYNKVIEIAKSLKSIDSMRQNQIESVLTSKEGQISSNQMHDIVNTLNIKQEEGAQSDAETHSNLSETVSNAESGDFLMVKNHNAKLLESVKENLDLMIKSDAIKKKNSKKRWWTPEEVSKPSLTWL